MSTKRKSMFSKGNKSQDPYQSEDGQSSSPPQSGGSTLGSRASSFYKALTSRKGSKLAEGSNAPTQHETPSASTSLLDQSQRPTIAGLPLGGYGRDRFEVSNDPIPEDDDSPFFDDPVDPARLKKSSSKKEVSSRNRGKKDVIKEEKTKVTHVVEFRCNGISPINGAVTFTEGQIVRFGCSFDAVAKWKSRNPQGRFPTQEDIANTLSDHFEKVHWPFVKNWGLYLQQRGIEAPTYRINNVLTTSHEKKVVKEFVRYFCQLDLAWMDASFGRKLENETFFQRFGSLRLGLFAKSKVHCEERGDSKTELEIYQQIEYLGRSGHPGLASMIMGDPEASAFPNPQGMKAVAEALSFSKECLDDKVVRGLTIDSDILNVLSISRSSRGTHDSDAFLDLQDQTAVRRNIRWMIGDQEELSHMVGKKLSVDLLNMKLRYHSSRGIQLAFEAKLEELGVTMDYFDLIVIWGPSTLGMDTSLYETLFEGADCPFLLWTPSHHEYLYPVSTFVTLTTWARETYEVLGSSTWGSFFYRETRSRLLVRSQISHADEGPHRLRTNLGTWMSKAVNGKLIRKVNRLGDQADSVNEGRSEQPLAAVEQVRGLDACICGWTNVPLDEKVAEGSLEGFGGAAEETMMGRMLEFDQAKSTKNRRILESYNPAEKVPRSLADEDGSPFFSLIKHFYQDHGIRSCGFCKKFYHQQEKLVTHFAQLHIKPSLKPPSTETEYNRTR